MYTNSLSNVTTQKEKPMFSFPFGISGGGTMFGIRMKTSFMQHCE